MVRALLCHNPNAGTDGKDKDSILAALKLAGYETSYVSVKDDDFKKTLAESVDLVVAAGGDGTIATVLTTLQNRETPVAILPLGTANNFARSLGIAGTPQELVETWKLDRFCRGQYRLGHRLLGHDLVSGELRRRRVSGFPRRRLQTQEAERRRQSAQGPRSLSGYAQGRQAVRRRSSRSTARPTSKTLLGVEVANIAFTGPGLPIASKADLGDGKLDVVFFETDERKKLIKWIDAPQDEKPPVTQRKATKVDITWTGPAGARRRRVLSRPSTRSRRSRSSARKSRFAF